ncbi:MAG: hypothetical protein JWQ40_580 [Segetibacter sp.]|jgi:uncharacterized LabA/DUF88 family protein|nr:hypothetical protein [Segetibacter sp.]
METTIKDLRLAMLIDADNVPYSNIKEMLEEIAKYGTPTFKRIYADWTKPTVSGWKGVLLESAITPVQQYSYTSGKNATDSAMIIDAMDILYSGRVDGFCIVSSDSDFTRLAIRLREAGMKVFGIGQKKTPVPFISACDKFIYIEILKNDKEENVRPLPKKSRSKKSATSKTAEPEIVEPVVNEPTAPEPIEKVSKEVVKLIADSINDLADEAGWTFLGDLGNLILKKQPDFDSRNYGYKKLVPLIKSLNQFEVDERATGKNNIKHAFVRNK